MLVTLPAQVDLIAGSVDDAGDHVVVEPLRSAVEGSLGGDLTNEVVGDGRILSSQNVVDPE